MNYHDGRGHQVDPYYQDSSKSKSKWPDPFGNKEIATLKAKIDHLSTEAEHLKRENHRLKSRHQEDLQEEQVKTASLRDQNRYLEVTVTKLQNDCREERSRTQSQQMQLDGRQREEPLAQERIRALQKGMSWKNQSLSERDSQAMDIGAEADQQRAEHLTLKQELSAMWAKQDSLKRTNANLEAEAITLRERLESASARGREEGRREAQATGERVQTLATLQASSTARDQGPRGSQRDSQDGDSSYRSTPQSESWMPDPFNSGEIAALKSKIDRLSDEAEHLKGEHHRLKSRHRELQEDLQEEQVKTASLQDQNRDLEVKVTSLQNDCREERSRTQTLQLKLDGTQRENPLAQERILALQKELSWKNQSLSERDSQAMDIGAEADQQREENLTLKRELSAMGVERDSLKQANANLDAEAIQLREWLESASARGSEEGRREAEATRERVQTLTSQILRLQTEVSEQRALVVQLRAEKEREQTEMDNLRAARGVQAAETELRERDLEDVKAQLAAVQASSAAREQGLRESQQREAERLRQLHKDDLAQRDRQRAADQDELQAQVETLLRHLSDDQRRDHDTVGRAMERLEQTSNATNYVLNAAYAAYQRSRQAHAQHRPAANVRPY